MDIIQDYRKIIKKNLSNTIDEGYIPELGRHKSGKVREIHFKSDKIGSPIIMIATDRVSSFDHILSRCIPFKGKVLNLFSKWAFANTKDIVDNAMIESPHDNVIIQKRMKKIPFEFVVRGYVWGSMAKDYENGKREFCGIKLSNKLLKYQKLPEPLFTPATKAEQGNHDINVSFEYMAKRIGRKLSSKLKNISIKLFNRASKLAKNKRFIFIDTKYEFGLDSHGKIFLIDEANTPDSSRYCSKDEYEKFIKIEKEMASGKYKNVSELIKQKAKLKIKELSKQFVRDALIKKGFDHDSIGDIPNLTNEDVIEVSYRYITLYEKLTGNKLNFPQTNIRQELLDKLKQENYIKGGVAIIIAGSDSDLPHIKKIQIELDKYDIASIIRICSAHKQPAKCEEIVNKYNQSIEPIVFISVAGGTDALSGVVSYHSVHPVISCPPNAEKYQSCINNPPISSNSLILRPQNVAKHTAKILGHNNPEIKEIINKKKKDKIKKLEEADKQF